MSLESCLIGLPPIFDAGVETLILGSFPSPASLAAQQYYAHRQNQFWRVLGVLLGEALPDADYAEKQRCLLRHHLGLWDVYRRCQRQGALDSAIREAEANDFSLLQQAPALRRIAFNGRTAAKFERQFARAGYEIHVLPSTSPAYTLAFPRKVEIWQQAWTAARP